MPEEEITEEENKEVETTNGSEDSRKEMSWRTFGIIAVTIFILWLGFLITGNIVKVPYTAKVIESVNEPYVETVCEDVQVPYIEQGCEVHEYSAEAKYTNGEWEGDFAIGYSLYEDGNPRDEEYKFYVRNNEQQSGTFIIQVNFWDGEEFLESSVYDRILVGGNETEYGYVEFDELWKMNPENADSFNLDLVLPELEECGELVKYRTENRCEEVIRYRNDWVQSDSTEYRSLLEHLVSD
jgi:hypothetical protein